MKKRLLSLLLTLSMVVSFFPGMTITASAAEAVPTITSQPKDVNVPNSFRKFSFAVIAEGEGLTYQWQFKKNGAEEFTDISGATEATYTTDKKADTLGEYRCVVTNTAGSVTSETAKATEIGFSYGSHYIAVDRDFPYGYTAFYAQIDNIVDNNDQLEIENSAYEWYECSSNRDVIGNVLSTEAIYTAPKDLAMGEYYYCCKMTVTWSDDTTETTTSLFGPVRVVEKTPIDSLDGVTVDWTKVTAFEFDQKISAENIIVNDKVEVDDDAEWCVKATDEMRDAIIEVLVAQTGEENRTQAEDYVDKMLDELNGWLDSDTVSGLQLTLSDTDIYALKLELCAKDGYFFLDMDYGTEYSAHRIEGDFYLSQGTRADIEKKIEDAKNSEPASKTYKFSELKTGVVLKAGDKVTNDIGQRAILEFTDCNCNREVAFDKDQEVTVESSYGCYHTDTDQNKSDYQINSGSWTVVPIENYTNSVYLVKTEDYKSMDIITDEIHQVEPSGDHYTITIDRKDGYKYFIIPYMDPYYDPDDDERQYNYEQITKMIPQAHTQFGKKLQTAEDMKDGPYTEITEGSVEIGSSVVAMVIKAKKVADVDNKTNNHLMVGMALVATDGIFRSVTINDTENGTVTASATKEKDFATVTLTATPADGYKLDSLTVKDAAGKDVTVKDGNFIMPRSAVTVTAVFVKDESDQPGGNDPVVPSDTIISIPKDEILKREGDTITLFIGDEKHWLMVEEEEEEFDAELYSEFLGTIVGQKIVKLDSTMEESEAQEFEFSYRAVSLNTDPNKENQVYNEDLVIAFGEDCTCEDCEEPDSCQECEQCAYWFDKTYLILKFDPDNVFEGEHRYCAVTGAVVLYIDSEGNVTVVEASEPPEAPAETLFTVKNETVKGKGDGSISGLTTDMEYSTDGSEWTPVTGTKVENLAAGTYLVRYKAKDGQPASKAVELTVAEGTKTLTVKFDLNGSTSASVEDKTGLAYGAKITAPSNPSRDGYKFDGWYQTANGKGKWDFTNNTVTADITLYAKWTKLIYTVNGKVQQHDGNPAVNATVKLMKNGVQQGETVETDSSGNYSFTSVPAGVYNIVVTHGGVSVTALVNVTDNATVETIKMPDGDKTSTINNEDAGVLAAVVGGLNDIANAYLLGNGETKVEIKLTVTAKNKTQINDADKTAIEAKVNEDAASGEKILEYVDLALTKKIDDGSEENYGNDNDKLLTIIIPFDTYNKTNFAVYRYHGGSAQVLSTTPVNGEYIVVGTDTITIYAKKFSTYAIGYTEGEDTPTPPTPPASGTPDYSGGSSSPNNSVTAPKTENGKVTITPKNASKGSTVKITATPDEGYELDTLTVTDKNGKAIAVTDLGNGTYSFIMPSGNVTVKVTFRAVTEAGCAGDETCPINAYTDIDTTAWYHDGVHYCVDNGLMSGLPGQLFAPNGTTTRAQIVTILWNLEGTPVESGAMRFNDVAASQWYAEAVRWAAANGIVTGLSEETFAPNAAVTREQLVTILRNYAQYKEIAVSEEMDIISYTDALSVSAWAMPAIQWACGSGVISGLPDGNALKLDPQGTATRAQVATMMMNFCENIVK